MAMARLPTFSIESGLDQAVNGFSIIAGDYDNDGFVDLYISRLGWYAGDGTLFHNNGDGTFTDVTAQSGVATAGDPVFRRRGWITTAMAIWTYSFTNNSGGVFDRHVPNRLFHNNGDGTFTDFTRRGRRRRDSPRPSARRGAITTMTAIRICS